MIPIILKLEEDELLFSYLQRLADANFLDFKQFMLSFVYPNKKAYNNVIRDYRIQMPHLLEQLGIEDWEAFYLKTTIYPAISITMTDAVQRNTLRIAFGKYYDPRTEIGKGANGDDSYVQSCPECDKEKKYIRRSHCIPGVKACWKHKCSFTGEPAAQEDIDYAIFVHDLLDANLDLNIKDVKKLVIPFTTQRTKFEPYARRLLEKFKTVENLKKAIKSETPEFTNTEFQVNSKPFKKIIDVTHCSCGCRNITTMSDAQLGNCPRCLSKLDYKEYYKLMIDRLGNGQYTVLTDYRILRDSIVMRHSCGIEYTTTIMAFMNGSRCHCESGYDINAIKELVEDSGNFKLIDYKGGFMHIHCNTCGKDSAVGFKEFRNDPKCPKCVTNAGENKLLKYQRMTKKVDPNFELLSHKYESYQHIGIFKHIPCGTVTPIRWGNFVKYHNCPKCGHPVHNNKPKGQEDYRILYNKLSDRIFFGKEFTSKEMIELGYTDPANRRNLINRLKKHGLVTIVKKGLWILNDEKKIGQK